MARYEEVHKIENQKGPGDARPTALDIIRDEKRQGDLVGKVIVITGCSSGLGVTTALALATTGATLYCTARDLAKAEKALAPLLSAPDSKTHLLELDLSRLSSVKACADELHRLEPGGINILINNAGVMAVPERQLTADGFELQMGTNHFAHFYLFCLLRDLLAAGSRASPSFASRVVNVASAGHRYGQVHLDDLTLAQPGAYTAIGAYGQSKTANIYMANALDRKYGSGSGGGTAGPIHGYSLMPGGIVTDLQRHSTSMMDEILKVPVFANYMKSPEQGAATTVFAAVARELEGSGGVYLEDCGIVGPVQASDPSSLEAGVLPGYAPWAYDVEKEEALWKASLKAVGLDEDFDKK